MNDVPNRFGEAGNEARAGYRPIAPRATARPQRPQHEFNDSDRNAARQAASELIVKRQRTERRQPAEAPPVRYADKDGRTLPANVSVPLKRAVEDRSDNMFAANVGMELHNRDKLAHDVDKARAENGTPTDPTHRDPNLVSPGVFGDPLSHMPPQIDPAYHLPENRTPTTPPPPGIDPELHRAMQHPQVRAELDAEFGKVSKQVQVANDFAVGAFNTVLPELANLRPDQVAPFLEQLKRTNPQRYNQAVKAANNVAEAGNARQAVERQRTQRERQQFERDAVVHDRAFDRHVANYTPEQRRAVAGEIQSYAQSFGVDHRTLTHLMNTNPIMRNAAFQAMMFDAAAANLARKQLAATRQQQRAANIPPVMKPGSGAPRTNPQSANLQALNAKLSKTADVKDAAALLIASRNAKRRR